MNWLGFWNQFVRTFVLETDQHTDTSIYRLGHCSPATTMQRAIVKIALLSLIASGSTIGTIAPIVNAAPEPTQIAQRDRDDRNNRWHQSNWDQSNTWTEPNDWDGNWDGNWERDRDYMISRLNGIFSRRQRHQFRDAIAAGTPPPIALAQLKLSREQKAKLRDAFPPPRNRQTDTGSQRDVLQQRYLQQIQQILNSRQGRKFRQAIGDGQSPRDALRDLRLSDDQKQQLRQLQDAYEQQLRGIRDNRDHRRNHRWNNDWQWDHRFDRDR
jgi:hypothetical protein